MESLFGVIIGLLILMLVGLHKIVEVLENILEQLRR